MSYVDFISFGWPSSIFGVERDIREKLEEIKVRFILGTLYIDTLGKIENTRKDRNCLLQNNELFVDGKSGLEVVERVSLEKRFHGKLTHRIQYEFSEHITVYTWCNVPVCWMLLGGSVENVSSFLGVETK